MAAVPLADAARLLGKPERTVRRWASQGKLPATRTADGWVVEIDGQVAATDRADGHSSGHVAAADAATGGQLATVPVSFLRELQARAEAAALWQGRAQVLEAELAAAREQLRALPAPDVPVDALRADSDAAGPDRTRAPAARPRRPWWAVWRHG
jgi:Helix-turn-helix domain